MRVRYATRAELVELLTVSPEERTVFEAVLDRLTGHGVDVDALVKVSVDLVGDDLDEDPGTAIPVMTPSPPAART